MNSNSVISNACQPLICLRSSAPFYLELFFSNGGKFKLASRIPEKKKTIIFLVGCCCCCCCFWCCCCFLWWSRIAAGVLLNVWQVLFYLIFWAGGRFHMCSVSNQIRPHTGARTPTIPLLLLLLLLLHLLLLLLLANSRVLFICLTIQQLAPPNLFQRQALQEILFRDTFVTQ